MKLNRYIYLSLAFILLSFVSQTCAQQLEWDETYKQFFVPADLKKAKVKTCNLKLYEIEDGEKSEMELYESYEFDQEGRTTHLLMAWGDTAAGEMDDLFFEYNANGNLLKETWYEGGIQYPSDHYYIQFNYQNGVLMNRCEYWVDDEWEEGDEWEKEELEYCFENINDEQGRLVFEGDNTTDEYYMYRYDGGYCYKYDCSDVDLSSVKNSTDLLSYSYLSAGEQYYQKFKGNLLVQEMYEDGGSVDFIYSGNRFTKCNEKVEKKVVYSVSVQYKKGIPLKATAIDKEEKGLKSFVVFEYTYY